MNINLTVKAPDPQENLKPLILEQLQLISFQFIASNLPL